MSIPERRIGLRRPRSASPSEAAIPVTVVSGFLGAGKTTLIRDYLVYEGKPRVAVIVNEFGELGLDAVILEGATGPVIELTNGCVCCESRGNMISALADLAREPNRFDAIVVETSGVADPFGVADVINETEFSHELTLAAIVTVVDAENFDAGLSHAELAYQQLTAADAFYVSKRDLVSQERYESVVGRIQRFNPAAMILSAEGGEGGRSVLGSSFPSRRLHESDQNVAAAPAGFESFSWESSDAALRLARLLDWAERLPIEVYRIKAAITGAEAYILHKVGSRITALPVADCLPSGTRVTAIGTGLDHAQLRSQLNDLLTTEESE